MSSKLRQNNTSSDSTTTAAQAAVYWAQTFTVAVAHNLDQIDLMISRSEDSDPSPGIVTLDVQGVDGSNKPDGASLGSATLNGDTFQIDVINGGPGTSLQSWLFSSPIPLAIGVRYAYVISVAGPDGCRMDFDNEGDPFANGEQLRTNNGGSTWTAHANDDMWFKEYGGFNDTSVTPADVNYIKQLVAAGNNQVWYESSAGTMEVLTASIDDVDCSETLSMFEAYGKIFIANKTDLKVADFQNSKIATANIGANPPDPGTVLTGGSSGAAMVVDYITALSSASVLYGFRTTAATFTTGETVTGTDDDGDAISFAMTAVNEVAAPHWYDWTVYGNSALYGALPPQATLGATFRGRAVLSGNQLLPHQWYMSRQASPFDFLYGINDAQSAVAGNNTDAGEIGDVVTALIPYKDDFFVFGCANTIWYLTGDPTSGGSLDELDLTTGIFGANSWCWGKGNDLYFWGANGIYRVTLPGGTPVCMSEVRLPKLVDDEAADPTTHRITLSYDKRRAGIVITITKLSDGTNSNYWYDIRTDSFFPESYPEECGVYSSIDYEATDTDFKNMMYGCKDGYIRKFDDSKKDDDIGATDEAISSYVTFGPFLLSSSAINEGKITGLDVILGSGTDGTTDSDGVSYELYTGKSAQEVLKKMKNGTPIAAAGAVTTSGRGRSTFRRKVRGVYGGVKLKNATAAQTWALEQLLIDVAKAGRLK